MEMVDSVVDLKSSRSIREHHFPSFEMLDAKIASSLTQITRNSCFKKTVNLEEPKGPTGRSLSSWKTDRVHNLRILRSFVFQNEH